MEVFEVKEEYSGFILKGTGRVMPKEILEMNLHPCGMDDFRMITFMN